MKCAKGKARRLRLLVTVDVMFPLSPDEAARFLEKAVTRSLRGQTYLWGGFVSFKARPAPAAKRRAKARKAKARARHGR